MAKLALIHTSLTVLAFISLSTAIQSGPLDCSTQILNGTEGSIQNPEFPNPYRIESNCSWILEISNVSMDIFLNIEVLDLDKGDDLTIYGANGTVIHKFTGKLEFGVVYSNAVNTTVELHTGSQSVPGISRRMFKLHYTTHDCEVQTNGSVVVLPSPYFAVGDGHFDCAYKINTTKTVDLAFPDFALIKGIVSVSDGRGIIANYTEATKQPADVLLSVPQIIIEMSLSTTHAQNFTVYYTQASECSKELNLTSAINLTSPMYPGQYDNNLDCRWIVQAPEHMTIQIQFTALTLADVGDYILMKDGSSQLSDNLEMFFLGSEVDDVMYLTSGNALWIQFFTNQFFGASGFNLTLTPQEFGGRLVNGGNFTIGGTNITSTESDIIYQLVSPPGNQVDLVFGADAVLWPNTVIRCYDGFSTNDNLIGYFETSKAFHPVFSNGNRILVIVSGFIQNGSMTQQTLSGAMTSVEDDGTLVNSFGESGSFSLAKQDHDYPAQAVWHIHNHEDNEMILLKIHNVDLGPNTTLTVYEGLSEQDWKIVELDQSSSDIAAIMIPKDREGCRVVYETAHPNDIKKETEEIEGTTVLAATYSLIPDCNNRLADKRAVITSPGYPNLYPYNAICNSIISIPDTKLVHLTFTTFDLAQMDYLRISRRNLSTVEHGTGIDFATLTGTTLPNDFVLPGVGNNSELHVLFSSSFQNNPSAGIQTAHGFNLTYSVIDCGGSFNRANGILMTPGFPKPVTAETNCVWLISLLNITKYKDSVNVVNFTVNYSGSGSLVIRDGLSANAESIPLTNDTILARSNVLWVSFEYKSQLSEQNSGSSFQMTFNTYECTKDHQCNNSVCMHEDWKCDGHDDCGDGSDEDGCTYNHDDDKGFKGWVLAVAIVATFIVTVLLVFAAQAIYKRYRYSNYDELRDLVAPVPT